MARDRGRTAVYRCYGDDDVLLYIGSSNNPRHRYGEHALSPLKPWWPQVVRKDETWYGTRDEAQAAEAEAIRTEDPRYNERLTARSRTTVIGFRFTAAEASAIDAARGTATRSEWLRNAALAAVDRQRLPLGSTDRQAAAVRENLAAAQGDCPHPKARVNKGLCGACGTHVGTPTP